MCPGPHSRRKQSQDSNPGLSASRLLLLTPGCASVSFRPQNVLEGNAGSALGLLQKRVVIRVTRLLELGAK